MNGKKKELLLVGALVILAWLVWISRPMWHWFFMWVYKNPAVWEPIALAAIIGIIVGVVAEARARSVRKDYDKDIDTAKDRAEEWEIKRLEHDREAKIKKINGRYASIVLILSVIAIVGGWAVMGSLQVMYPQCYLSQNLEVSQIAELPNIDPSEVRIMPRAVAERYARDALQYPRYKLGTSDIAFINQTPHWTYPLIPDGVPNFFLIKDKGSVYVDMTTSKKNTKIVEQDMEIGEGMGITDWYKWKLYKEKYWVDYEDPYFVPTEEKLHIAVPVISYEYHWRFPTLYTVPKYTGTALIDSEANIEFLTPEQALKHPVLENQKLFPERLSRYYIDSFRYIRGIKNKLFFHTDQLEIAEIAATVEESSGESIQRNEQPFLVTTEGGKEWFIACEPYGKAHGIYKIFLIDARVGKIQFYEQPKAEALTEPIIGPVKACDYVRKENPIVDWNRMTPVEPIPVMSNGKLYWEVRVIPYDASGIAYTAMVDSRTTDVIELKTDEEISQFISGKHARKPEIPAETVRKLTTAIVIISENGQEIQRIELFRNQTIAIIP
jgi:hypothetical protein